MSIKARGFFILALMPCAMATAQDWSELKTLSFTPVLISPSQTAEGESLADGASDGVDSRNPAIGRPDTEQEPEFIINRIRAAVADIEAYETANDPNAPGLVPLLIALADIYQETGDYGDAIPVLERAQSIVRRHQGLYSLDQAGLIEQIIDIRSAITPNELSAQQESDLRELVQRNPGDPRNVEILTKTADRQLDIARDVLINGIPPEFTLNVNANVSGWSPRFRQPRTARSLAASAMRQARFNYGSAMNAALNSGPTRLSRLLELEDSIIDTYYFELMNSEFRSNRISYRNSAQLRFGGVRALSAKLANTRRYGESPEAVASVIAELADWYLMFGAFGRAMDTYEEAAAHLRETENGEARVAAMFSTETPIPLPAFVPNANVYEGLSNIRGHFDVHVRINRFGGVRDFEVVGSSPNATDAIEKRLKKFVYQSRFRPRYIDGEWLESDDFTIRYEFGLVTS